MSEPIPARAKSAARMDRGARHRSSSTAFATSFSIRRSRRTHLPHCSSLTSRLGFRRRMSTMSAKSPRTACDDDRHKVEGRVRWL